MNADIAANDITLGILAGGRASRLGGCDKAWLERAGVPQVLRWVQRYPGEHGPVLVSANRNLVRYQQHGLIAVGDRASDLGPLGGLDALAAACATEWLFTLPVDLVGTNDCLLRTLSTMRHDDGAYAVDDDGVQPLVALWHRNTLREACCNAIVSNTVAIRDLQTSMHMARVVFNGFRFGNLNTPADLALAGFAQETDTP